MPPMYWIFASLIYAGCYILAYILMKRESVKSLQEWTKGDRRFCLIVSLLGPGTILTALILIGIRKLRNDEPASW